MYVDSANEAWLPNSKHSSVSDGSVEGAFPFQK